MQQQNYRKVNNINLKNIQPLPPLLLDFKDWKYYKKYFDVFQKNKWLKPTPIQAQSVPIILGGKNLIAISRTGSGKTLAYMIPVINHINDYDTRALIIVPSRQLAIQISNEFLKFNVDVGCVYGGIPKFMQRNQINKKIVVCTPGRMMDFLNQQIPTNFDFVIIDEADRLLEVGFDQHLKVIMAKITGVHQMYMFTATWNKDTQKLGANYIKSPVILTIGGSTTSNSNIRQDVLKVNRYSQKLDELIELINYFQHQKILVFTNTKRMTMDLYYSIKDLPKLRRWVGFINGDKTQDQREKTLSAFRSDNPNILIATDVASRGLDITDIEIVVNYDFPMKFSDYPHRIGRTGRYDRKGHAISFIYKQQKYLLQSLVQYLVKSGNRVQQWLLKETGTNLDKYNALEQSMILLDKNELDFEHIMKESTITQLLTDVSFYKQNINNETNQQLNISFQKQDLNTSFQTPNNLSFAKHKLPQESFYIQKKAENQKISSSKFDLALFSPKAIELKVQFKGKQIALAYQKIGTTTADLLILDISNSYIKQAKRKALLQSKDLESKRMSLINENSEFYNELLALKYSQIKREFLWKAILYEIRQQELFTCVINLPTIGEDEIRLIFESLKQNLPSAIMKSVRFIVQKQEKLFKTYLKIFDSMFL